MGNDKREVSAVGRSQWAERRIEMAKMWDIVN
jgi:hypothetical protein